MLILLLVFFFFKQKTAYEMRISDWSSDVCSSDLLHHALAQGFHPSRTRARRDLSGAQEAVRRSGETSARRGGTARQRRVRRRHFYPLCAQGEGRSTASTGARGRAAAQSPAARPRRHEGDRKRGG